MTTAVANPQDQSLRYAHAKRNGRHREQGCGSDQGSVQRGTAKTARAQDRRHENPEIRKGKTPAALASLQNIGKQDSAPRERRSLRQGRQSRPSDWIFTNARWRFERR